MPSLFLSFPLFSFCFSSPLLLIPPPSSARTRPRTLIMSSCVCPLFTSFLLSSTHLFLLLSSKTSTTARNAETLFSSTLFLLFFPPPLFSILLLLVLFLPSLNFTCLFTYFIFSVPPTVVASPPPDWSTIREETALRHVFDTEKNKWSTTVVKVHFASLSPPHFLPLSSPLFVSLSASPVSLSLSSLSRLLFLSPSSLLTCNRLK